MWKNNQKERCHIENIDLNKRKLQRPAGNRDYLNEGLHEGTIEAVELKELASDYHPSGKRIAVMIKVSVEDGHRNSVSICEFPTYTWDERGNWYKILKDLDMLPEPGEEFVLDDLVGLKVKVMVENVEKNQKTYSNIAKMRRINS